MRLTRQVSTSASKNLTPHCTACVCKNSKLVDVLQRQRSLSQFCESTSHWYRRRQNCFYVDSKILMSASKFHLTPNQWALKTSSSKNTLPSTTENADAVTNVKTSLRENLFTRCLRLCETGCVCFSPAREQSLARARHRLPGKQQRFPVHPDKHS